jgi:hypothetical protein
MPEFRFLSLGDDVTAASQKEVQNDTWLIYPTERSCREALKRFQQNWQPLNAEFLSMEEFKRRLIYSDLVRLQDEKRLVCLYQAMTAADKAVFHIEKYPDLIEWGQHFFELFEDLAEEETDAELLLQRIHGNEIFCQEWQSQNYERMLAIRQQYREFISAKGFTDLIFDHVLANIHVPAGIRRFVFVNQFYYSRLERSIISYLTARQLAVVILYQGLPEWLDQTTLRSCGFKPEEAYPDKKLPFELVVFETGDIWQMALAFLQAMQADAVSDCKEHFIIDAQFLQQPYHKVFDARHFSYAHPALIHNTGLFHFLQAMGRGLENLLHVNGRLMVRLDWLLQAFGLQGFLKYFRPDWTEARLNAFIGFICSFSADDVLYLDLELQILNLDKNRPPEPENALLLQEILALLKYLNKISSAHDLVSVLDVPQGITVERLLSEEEKTCTNLQESFYTALANFVSLDELALVKDWQLLYPGVPVSSGIFSLFLDFIKPRRYQINSGKETEPAATLTNLMDTRNLKAEEITFLNLTEGVLPSSRTPVWLFNEKQKKEIGLKTWEDVRNWEKHYFYRIISTAKKVRIYTVANREKDVEPSSFLSELHDFYLQCGKAVQPVWKEVSVPADILLKNLLTSDLTNPLAQPVSVADLNNTGRQAAFFNLPCEQEQDFGEKQTLAVTWSACEHLLNNPVLFLVRDLKRLRERTVRIDETLNRKMFGKLLHLYLMKISQRLAEQNGGLLSMRWEWLNNSFLQTNLEHTMQTPSLSYQMPANYNKEFLALLLTPFLTDMAGRFFRVELGAKLDSALEYITIIPEAENSSEYEQKYRQLLSPEESGNGFSVNIKGRADLRLETDQSRFIIDFKTGDFDELQLVFYMWFYYLIDHPELQNSVRLFVYRLLEKSLTEIGKTGRTDPQKLKSRLIDALNLILSDGFTPPHKISSYDRSLGISRADLLKNMSPGEDGE